MGRTLEVEGQGSARRFTTRRLSRSLLYGRKRWVPVDAQGRECRAAALARDGRFLLPPGSTATLHLDEDGGFVEGEELRPARAGQGAALVGEAQFLVKNDAGSFLLVGEQAGFEGYGGHTVCYYGSQASCGAARSGFRRGGCRRSVRLLRFSVGAVLGCSSVKEGQARGVACLPGNMLAPGPRATAAVPFLTPERRWNASPRGAWGRGGRERDRDREDDA